MSKFYHLNANWRRSVLYGLLAMLLLGGSYAVQHTLAPGPGLSRAQSDPPPGYWQQDFSVTEDLRATVILPQGYRVEALNLSIERPRLMFFAGDQLLIGSRNDRIYRLDPPYREAVEIAHLAGYPHSMVVRDGYLYIARTPGLYRVPYSPETQRIEESDLEQVVSYRATASHSSRTVKLGPDNRLYMSMGWPGNCADFYADESYPPWQRMGGIFVVDESTTPAKLVPYASGLRNPIGFDWHPDSGVMYATNNGPDHLGYGQPPEYFSRIDKGSFHGMPWYQFDGEKMIVDKCANFPAPRPIEDATLPAATFIAHRAPLDMMFVAAETSEYYGDAIAALHGSWVKHNGTAFGANAERRPPGLSLVKFENGKPIAVRDLVSGFQLPDGRRWATPAGVAWGPDGAIYFTSDRAVQGLYRVQRTDVR